MIRKFHDAKINNNNATAMLTIDRSEFNVRYGSGSFFDNLGDNLIYDDFNLETTFNPEELNSFFNDELSIFWKNTLIEDYKNKYVYLTSSK